MAERERRPFSSKSSATSSQPSRDAGSFRVASTLEAGAPIAHPPLVTTPIVAADEVAQMALMLRTEAEAKGKTVRCDACDGEIEGEPAGSGLYMWSRGDDELRFEEPPLCEGCATAIGTTALRRWDEEDDEEG